MYMYLKDKIKIKDLSGQEIEVYPGFPYISGTKETAEKWSNNAVPEEVDNKFIGQIVSLDYRGNGGRAYQVIIGVNGKDVLVDLRERHLLDIINVCGILQQGTLNCSLKFIKEKSQTTLTRIGSPFDQDTQRVVIPEDELEYGCVYFNKHNRERLYLGRFMVHSYIEGCNYLTPTVEKSKKATLKNLVVNPYTMSKDFDDMFSCYSCWKQRQEYILPYDFSNEKLFEKSDTIVKNVPTQDNLHYVIQKHLQDYKKTHPNYQDKVYHQLQEIVGVQI